MSCIKKDNQEIPSLTHFIKVIQFLYIIILILKLENYCYVLIIHVIFFPALIDLIAAFKLKIFSLAYYYELLNNWKVRFWKLKVVRNKIFFIIIVIIVVVIVLW